MSETDHVVSQTEMASTISMDITETFGSTQDEVTKIALVIAKQQAEVKLIINRLKIELGALLIVIILDCIFFYLAYRNFTQNRYYSDFYTGMTDLFYTFAILAL